MAVSWGVRAGSTLRRRVVYWESKLKVDVVNTDGFTARFQVRESRPPQRVLINTQEWAVPDAAPKVEDPETGLLLPDPVPVAPAGTLLVRLVPGVWDLKLGRTVTRTLPAVSRFELELVNDVDPEDVTTLAVGVIRIEPEGVTDVIS